MTGCLSRLSVTPDCLACLTMWLYACLPVCLSACLSVLSICKQKQVTTRKKRVVKDFRKFLNFRKFLKRINQPIDGKYVSFRQL